MNQNLINFGDTILVKKECEALKDIYVQAGRNPERDTGIEIKDGHVHILNIPQYGLTSLPDSIGQLLFLKELYLHHNKLVSLPDSIGQLQDLEKLELCGNRLTSVPDSIGNFKSLRYLNLSYNQLKNVPETIRLLKLLETLGLSKNEIVCLPDQMGNLQSLKDLGLSNNQLASIPDSIGDLRFLEYLGISHNHLLSLPSSIGKLQLLKKLELYENELTQLPDSIGELQSLEELFLSNNMLTDLPESLGNLRSLKWLDSCDNNLNYENEKIKLVLRKLESTGTSVHRWPGLYDCSVWKETSPQSDYRKDNVLEGKPRDSLDHSSRSKLRGRSDDSPDSPRSGDGFSDGAAAATTIVTGNPVLGVVAGLVFGDDD